MASATAIFTLPKLLPITDKIATILKILTIIAIKNCTDKGNHSAAPIKKRHIREEA